ncbi:hypothetical protein AnigIFM62618_005328 [Aspergillus niger]|nr:hypothetical protein AnigIFM62618_005328 [Aspergillus niger]
MPDENEPSPARLEDVTIPSPAQMGCSTSPDPKALSSGRDPVTPSPTRAALDSDAIRPAADLSTVSSARIHAQLILLPSPILLGTSRSSSITVTDWDAYSRRNAAARILTLQLIGCVDNDDKLCDEVASWYQDAVILEYCEAQYDVAENMFPRDDMTVRVEPARKRAM